MQHPDPPGPAQHTSAGRRKAQHVATREVGWVYYSSARKILQQCKEDETVVFVVTKNKNAALRRAHLGRQNEISEGGSNLVPYPSPTSSTYLNSGIGRQGVPPVWPAHAPPPPAGRPSCHPLPPAACAPTGAGPGWRCCSRQQWPGARCSWQPGASTCTGRMGGAGIRSAGRQELTRSS